MLTIPCINFFIYVHISIDTNTVCTADMIKIDMVNGHIPRIYETLTVNISYIKKI